MKPFILNLLIFLILILTGSVCFAQGTIYGAINNSDMTVPANGEIFFIGYLDDTDEEIRIESSIGAGYDAGNWYDDFQNYLTEAPGNPYDFHFFNLDNNEMAILSNAIPFNSFQQEDVILELMTWIPEPVGVKAAYQPDSTVKISWDYDDLFTYRVYRRPASSAGSFFRIDNPSGSLDDFGIADSFFIDSDVNLGETYEYLVVTIDNGTIGMHSDIFSVYSGEWICGDINGNGLVNILDMTFFIAYLYKGGPPPIPPQAADVNNSGTHNILDMTYLIAYLYKGGPELNCPEIW